MLNIGNPSISFKSCLLPNKGIGLVRMEHIISNYIKIHPNALLDYPNVDTNVKNWLDDQLFNYSSPENYFIEKLAKGLSKIASCFYPKDVIIRLSDFKSNEYRNLLGGFKYEPFEENPMLGWRGASRYYSKDYEKGFELECKALKYLREKMNMTNVIIMIPFCRTTEECQIVLNLMEKYGLKRGLNGLQIYLMCEIPSNVIEADIFSKYVDGVSIGGNDLLQLTLGLDRDSEKLKNISNYHNLSYKRFISKAIQDYKKNGIKVGYCGQQPSDDIDFFNFLVEEGIDSISITPDSVLKTLDSINKINSKL
jgi:pyruvate,water dikinase